MQQAQLTIRIDQKLKKQAQNTAKNFGLPLSSLIKTFLTNIVKTKKFAINENSDEYFDSIIMNACRDKQITSKLEKLADAVIKISKAIKKNQSQGKFTQKKSQELREVIAGAESSQKIFKSPKKLIKDALK